MRAKVGASLLILGLLCLAAPLGAAAPEYVEVDGEWELDRRLHDACVVAVPDVIGGSIHIEADFVKGWISGWIEGDGDFTSSYTLPAECEHDDPDDYDKTHLETWTGTLSNISGEFEGEFDTATGAFELEVSIYVDSVGEASAPGRQYMCNTDSWTQTCDLGPIYTDQLADISGVVSPGGVSDGEIDWYTAFCATVSPGRTDWGDNCPTLGWWEADPTDVIWGKNEPPEVGEIGSSPAEPNSQDTITFSVAATDSDGDELSYTWYFDGVIDPASGPSASWRKPTPGDHEIEVDVSDGVETIERYLTIRVSEAVGAGDQDDDGVPDDEDLCPTEWGQGEDGCPPFAATLGCTPAQPMPEDAVTCSVTVAGVHVGETVEYEWYLDGDGVGSGGASWTWPKSADGDHEVLVDVLGQGRTATASLGLEVGGGVVDKDIAGFFIQNLACNSNITSDEILGCTATLKRDRDDVGALTVTWRIDGQTASRESVPGNTSSWTLDRPAPGDHTVQALVVDPVTNYAQLASAPAKVRPGQNYPIPPGVQAMAAGLSTLTIGGWLWLEHLTKRREAAVAAPPQPRTDVPDWVFDKRPLAQIWADEATAEAARRNLNPQEWWRNPVTGDFVHVKVLEAEVDRLEQASLKDEWRRYVDVFGTYRGSEEVGAFIKQNESNIWRGDRIDADQMERLRRAIERLRRAETGFRKVPEYTSKQQFLDYMGSLSQSTGARIVLALGTAGKSEMLLAPWAMHQRMVDRARAGWSDLEIATATYKEFKNEAMMYAGGTAVVGLGAPSIGRAVVSGTGQVAKRLLPTAWTKALSRAAKAIYQTATRPIGPDLGEVARKGARRLVEAATGWNESLRQAADRTMKLAGKAYEFGSQPIGRALTQVRKSWELSRKGVSNAWNKAGDLARLSELRGVNAQLAEALEDLTRKIDDTGGAATKDVPSLAFTSQEQKHLWKITDDMFRLTPDELAAARLLRDMPDAYQAAVRQGLVPMRTHQLVNHARDKILKHAMVRAYRNVPEYVRNGLQRIEITGTGANPRSVRASSGWTDFDCRTLGAQNSEEAFVRAWGDQVRRGAPEVGMPGFRLDNLDAQMFAGLRVDAPAAGFRNQSLLEWVDVDGKFSGKALSPTRKGNLVIGYRADAPMGIVQSIDETGSAVWGLESPPRMPHTPPGTAAAADVLDEIQRMVNHSHAHHPPANVLENLRFNGKYALRSWKLQTVGTGFGEAIDPGIRVLEMMKANRHWAPNADQIRQAIQAFERWTGMSAGV